MLKSSSLSWSLILLFACTSQEAPWQASPPVPAQPPVAATPSLKKEGAPRPEVPPSLTGSQEVKPPSRLRGIDISRYQPTVDWNAIKPAVSFVFIKATENTGMDPLFVSHWSGAKKVGIPRSAYHFFHPKHDVAMQVSNFVKQMKPDPGEIPPVVDVEEFKEEYKDFTCDQLGGMLERFSQGVEKEIGRKPIIYTNHQTWRTSFCDYSYFTDHPLWLAAYTQAEPKIPEGWSKWNFWQYTDKGQVNGISGQVDQNYFNGTEEDLQTLISSK